MNNELEVFKNEEFGTVRTLNEGDTVLFCASDVAKALGYSRPRDAVAVHCKYITKAKISHPQSPAKQIEMLFVPEYDVYRMVSSPSVPVGNRKNDFIAWMQSLGFLTKIYLKTRKEIAFGEKLSETLKPFDIAIEKQYPCKDFYIDFYIPTMNIAIEYDEKEHKNYSYEAHELRQEVIENCLGCRFIRVSDVHGNDYNIGYIIKQIFNYNFSNKNFSNPLDTEGGL